MRPISEEGEFEQKGAEGAQAADEVLRQCDDLVAAGQRQVKMVGDLSHAVVANASEFNQHYKKVKAMMQRLAKLYKTQASDEQCDEVALELCTYVNRFALLDLADAVISDCKQARDFFTAAHKVVNENNKLMKQLDGSQHREYYFQAGSKFTRMMLQLSDLSSQVRSYEGELPFRRKELEAFMAQALLVVKYNTQKTLIEPVVGNVSRIVAEAQGHKNELQAYWREHCQPVLDELETVSESIELLQEGLGSLHMPTRLKAAQTVIELDLVKRLKKAIDQLNALAAGFYGVNDQAVDQLEELQVTCREAIDSLNIPKAYQRYHSHIAIFRAIKPLLSSLQERLSAAEREVGLLSNQCPADIDAYNKRVSTALEKAQAHLDWFQNKKPLRGLVKTAVYKAQQSDSDDTSSDDDSDEYNIDPLLGTGFAGQECQGGDEKKSSAASSSAQQNEVLSHTLQALARRSVARNDSSNDSDSEDEQSDGLDSDERVSAVDDSVAEAVELASVVEVVHVPVEPQPVVVARPPVTSVAASRENKREEGVNIDRRDAKSSKSTSEVSRIASLFGGQIKRRRRQSESAKPSSQPSSGRRPA